MSSGSDSDSEEGGESTMMALMASYYGVQAPSANVSKVNSMEDPLDSPYFSPDDYVKVFLSVLW